MTLQTPAEPCAACRQGWSTPAPVHATGATQCTLIALPGDLAFLQLVQRSHRPSPMLDTIGDPVPIFRACEAMQGVASKTPLAITPAPGA